MGSKVSKFTKAISSATPTKADVSSRNLILQSVLESDTPDYQFLNIDVIEFNPNNDYGENDTEQDIRELAEDIRRNGLLHNIVVSYTGTGTYKLLSGERRLRAYKLLYEETNEPKYATIYALIRRGLSEIEEMIILDAANLQARGAQGDEKRYRKTTARFVENLKRKFDISDEEAVSLTKQYANVTESVIEKNITLENDLHPALLELLDQGYINKTQAYEYARLDSALQETIAHNLSSAKESGIAEFKKLNEVLSTPVREIRELTDSLSTQKEALKSLRRDIKEVKAIEASSDPATAAQVRVYRETLEEQKREYNKAIKKTESAINQRMEALSASDDDKADPEEVKRKSTVAELNTLVDAAAKRVITLANASVGTRIAVLTPEEKRALRHKLTKIILQLEDITEVIK